MNEVTAIYEFPLISIIIPCYNQGRYLPDAFSSIENLNYPNTETILVDDGSTDNTADIAHSYPWVKYFYQHNKGLPAARNAGFSLSKGEFLVFLDADDWLYPDAIIKNLIYLQADPVLALVSGCHNLAYMNGEVIDEGSDIIKSDHYIHLLYRNYIGNPATVLYPRRTIEEFPFDTSPDVKACEDYDQYLKISRKYPILHHQEKISVYRKHDENMSDNYPLMLTSVLNALHRQEPYLENEKERMAWKGGMQQWTSRYTNHMYRNIFYKKGISRLTGKELKQIFLFKKEFLRILLNITKNNIKSGVSRYSPGFIKSIYKRIKQTRS